jgi:hypothetical protein
MILTGSFGVPAGNAEKLIIPTIKRITAREYANLTSFFELIIKALFKELKGFRHSDWRAFGRTQGFEGSSEQTEGLFPS